MHHLLIAISVLMLCAAPARANCEDAVYGYNAAVSEIDYQLDRYASCISNSMGNDECMSEFRRLRNAQGDFEVAVSDYARECG